MSYIIYYGNKTKEADIDVYRGREERENLNGSGLKSGWFWTQIPAEASNFSISKPSRRILGLPRLPIQCVLDFFAEVTQGLSWQGINLATS